MSGTGLATSARLRRTKWSLAPDTVGGKGKTGDGKPSVGSLATCGAMWNPTPSAMSYIPCRSLHFILGAWFPQSLGITHLSS